MNKNLRILMAVTDDLVTDQRVHRSCMALTEAGYEVVLIGRRLPESLPLRRPYRTIRMHLLFRRSAAFYAEYNLRLLWRMLWMRADLIYANDTDTLLGCYWASKLKCKPLMMDAHELFCEVPELVGRNKVRRVWQWVEDLVIPHLSGACTVCSPIAEIYRQRYGVDFKVVRNVPISQPSDAATPTAQSHPRTLLYQGAVNVGRGVDWMIEAMAYLPNYRFVVAGDGDELSSMRQLAASKPYADRITFLGRLAPDELRQHTRQAYIGISLLANMGKNYYYSLPNRIADFVQAGVPVLATDFPEIRKVVEEYRIGTLVEGQDPQLIAQKITEMAAYWDALDTASRTEIFSRASRELSWDHDKKILLDLVNAIIPIPIRY